MALSAGGNRPAAAVSRSSRARCAWPTGRSEQLTCRLGTLRLAERDLGDAAHQLGVIPAGHAGHARQAGVVVQVGIGIDLEDPHPPLVVQPERSEEHTSELQSRLHLVCRLLLEKK